MDYKQDEPEDHELVQLTYEEYKHYIGGGRMFKFDELCVELARERKKRHEAEARVEHLRDTLRKSCAEERNLAISENPLTHGCPEATAMQREIARLHDMIREFCAGQEWAVAAWRNRAHIKPLFDEMGYA